MNIMWYFKHLIQEICNDNLKKDIPELLMDKRKINAKIGVFYKEELWTKGC